MNDEEDTNRLSNMGFSTAESQYGIEGYQANVDLTHAQAEHVRAQAETSKAQAMMLQAEAMKDDWKLQLVWGLFCFSAIPAIILYVWMFKVLVI